MGTGENSMEQQFLRLPVAPESKWFCWREVFQHGSELRYPPNFSVFGHAVVLAHRLVHYRERAGVPFRVTSWYRDTEANRRAGGAPNSWHLTGGAMDFVPESKFAEVARDLDKNWEGGLGIYSGYIHVDIGPFRRWKG